MKKRKKARQIARVTVAQQQTSQISTGKETIASYILFVSNRLPTYHPFCYDTESAIARILDEPPPYSTFSARQTARDTVAIPPQTSAEQYTNPVPPQASVHIQSYHNPVYTQQQTSRISTGKETYLSHNHPFCYDTESATATGLTRILDEPPPYRTFSRRHTARDTVTTPPQTSAEQYTNPVPPRASVHSQSYRNPVYTQQQTSRISTGEET